MPVEPEFSGVEPPVHLVSIPNTRAPSIPNEPLSSAVSGTWVEQHSSAALWAIVLIVLSSGIWGLGIEIGFQTALAIQMGLGFLAAVAGLFIPSLGIMAVSMLAALDGIAVELLLTGGLLRFNTLNYWLLIVIALSIPFVLRLRDLNTRALQLFTLLVALELIFSLNVPEGLQDVLNLVTTFGMVVYFARSLKDPQALYWAGIVNGILAGLGGLIFILQMAHLPYANPNNWTYFNLTALFSICIAFDYAHKYHKGKGILLVLAVVNFVWVFISASRGSLLIALLCGFYLFLSTRSLKLSTAMIAVAALAGLWVASQFAQQQLYTISRIQLLFDPTQSAQRRTSERSAIAQAGIDIFLKNPMGIGTGSFNKIVGSASLQVRNRPAHSGWIKTLAENGIPGVLLMAAFIASFAVAGFRRRRQGLFLFGLFITLVLGFAFIAKEFQGKSLWFLTASGIALLHPEEMQSFLQRKAKEVDIDIRQRLREVRYGPRR
jgi:O-antigen ligase